MKIIFANRHDCFSRLGGDTTQMILTKKYLEKLFNLSIDIVLSPEELKTKTFDILHVFNIVTYSDSAAIIDAAYRKDCKIVLSPIYWDRGFGISYYGLTKFNLFRPRSFYRYLKDPILAYEKLLSKESYGSAYYRRSITRILTLTDLLLPNSKEEYEIIQNHFPLTPERKYLIVPNAFELPSYNDQCVVSKDEKLVIHVGRISPLKNQLGTLSALYKETDYSIIFIGKVEDKHYYDYLYRKAQKRGNVEFIDEIPNEEVTGYYKKAKVHVLPSFGETTGLVSLEAFYYGCEIVVSDYRFLPVDYYRFKEIAHICNPYNVGSITASIRDALNHPKQGMVNKDEYFSFFNYETVARMTYEAYRLLL